MRVMVIGKANEQSEKGLEPTPEMMAAFAEMDRFTEELVKAGIYVAGAGLQPMSKSKRVVIDGASRMVMDGPFTETKEVVAGFQIWEVKDLDEAVAWVMRHPQVTSGRSEIDIRPFYEAEDLGDFIKPEERGKPRDGERGKLGVA